MLADFFSWWLARMTELLPGILQSDAARAKDGVVIDIDDCNNIAASIRRGGRREEVSLGAAARFAGRKEVYLRPPNHAVLVKQHIVPMAPRRQMDQMLRYELLRITPFPIQDLFWRWDSHAKRGEGPRTEVTLTMVPRMAVASALDALEAVGLKVGFVEVGAADRPLLLPVRDDVQNGGGNVLVRGLAWACAGLALVALLLPVGLQALAIHATNQAIAEVQPAITEIDALRRGIVAGDAGRDILDREAERTGDVMQILATVTRILPDDTFLVDFSLRDRQMTLSGRSASAPRLITGLSADTAIRNTAFAAPVTRMEGATADVFSIKAEIAK